MTEYTDIDYGVKEGRGGRLHGGARIVARIFVGLGTALAGGLVIAGIVGLASQNAPVQAAVTAAPVKTTTVAPHVGKATLAESFTGKAGAAPSSSWIAIDKTRPSTAWELENYRPFAAVLDGKGRLAITVTKDAAGSWTSGRIESARTNYTAGPTGKLRVSARIALPAGGKGYWPAFWMLGSDIRTNAKAWPANGEVDIMEHLGTEPGTIHGTFHGGTLSGGKSPGIGGIYKTAASLETGFHLFETELDRRAGTITWFVDGHAYHRVTRAQMGTKVWDQATGHGFYLLLNVAVGGWSGNPDANTKSGVAMLVDNVTVYAS
jgi:beta-glucanase (GH16 family)